MLREHQVVDLIGRIYDAALDVSQWPGVLQDIVRITHSNTGNLAECDLTDGSTRPIAAVNMPLQGFADYEAYYWQQDIWTPKPGTFEIGRAYTSQRTISDRVLLRSGFYEDWMKPLGLFHGMGGIPVLDGNQMLLIGVHRPWSRHRPYGDEELRLMQQVFPHLRRALQIQRRLDGVSLERDALAETADHYTRGVLTFNREGRLLWMNRAAETICRQADGLTIRHGTITAAVAEESRQLQHLLLQMPWENGGRTRTTGDSLLVSRPSGRRPYIVLVSPLQAGNQQIEARRPAIVMFVSDPERTPELSTARLSRLYGLTPAEAQLAQELADGWELQEIAAASSRTMNTVRSQLKQVFHKTSTKRQAQLVRLVLQTEGFIHGRATHA